MSPAALDLALLRGAMEEIPLGVATMRDDQILYANQALERIFGAVSGGLEGRRLDELFDAAMTMTIQAFLDNRRVYDGRVHGRTLDQRELDAELHVERYQSGGGVGGFLLMRDVSHEMSALARLVSELGGVLVRVRVDETAIEHVSPSIAGLVGIEARTLMADPSCLRSLASEADQQRVAQAYQRLARGEAETESVTLAIRVDARSTIPATLYGTGRRDTSGVVRHVDGAVVPLGSRYAPSMSAPPATEQFTGVSAMMALCDAAGDLLREAAQLSTSAAADLRTLRGAVVSAIPDGDTARKILDGLDRMNTALSASNAINRRVRRALDTRVSRSPVRDVLDTLRVTLAPLVGDGLEIDPGQVGDEEIDNRVDEVTLGLMQLVLYALRASPGARVVVCATRSAERPREIVIEIGTRGEARSARTSDVPMGTRRPESDKVLTTAATLLSTAGCMLETDDRTDGRRCTRVRLLAAS